MNLREGKALSNWEMRADSSNRNQPLKHYEDNSCFHWKDSKEPSSIQCHGQRTRNCYKLQLEEARYFEVFGMTGKASKENK